MIYILYTVKYFRMYNKDMSLGKYILNFNINKMTKE